MATHTIDPTVSAAKPSLTARVETALSRFSEFANSRGKVIILCLVAGMALGSVAWFAPLSRRSLLATNKLSYEQQLAAIVPPLALGAVFALVGVGASSNWMQGKRWGERAKRSVLALALTSLCCPLAMALLPTKVEVEHPWFTLAASLVAGALSGVATATLLGAKVELKPRAANRFIGPLLVCAMWAGYAVVISRLAIANHHAMNTRTIDLGIYDQIFYQSAHGNFLGCNFVRANYHGSAHFDPILVILSPLYRLHPRAETLLVLQSVWVGSGVIPVYLLFKRAFERTGPSLIGAACYALHPAIHGANLYEFHSLTLATVPMLWTLLGFTGESKWRYWGALAIALLVREDVPIMLSFVGLAGLLGANQQLRLRGAMTVAVCAAYFVIVKAVFMTSSGVLMKGGAESYSFSYYYADMIPAGKGLGGMVLTLLSNPAFVLRHALSEAKVLYVLKVCGPLLLLPALARGRRWHFFYGATFILLATREPVFSTGFQYSACLLPFLFAAFPQGLSACAQRLHSLSLSSYAAAQKGLLAACLVSSVLVSWKYGAFLENDAFRGGFSPIARSLTPEQKTRFEWLETTKAMIEPGASVGVTNRTGPHVSNRSEAHFYGKRWTNYVFIDERDLKKERLSQHRSAVRDGRLIQVAKHGSLVLLRATSKPKANAEEEAIDVRELSGDEPTP